MATGMFENDNGNCLQPPTVPDSPDSIPLPDSPPREVELRGEVGEPGDVEMVPIANTNNTNNVDNPSNNGTSRSEHDNASDEKNNHSPSSRSRKNSGSLSNRLPEEYDPSEPLTSSDEEEHSLHLIEGKVKKRNTRDKSRKTILESKATSPKSKKRATSPLPQNNSKSSPKPVSPNPPKDVRPTLVASKLDLNSIPVPPDECRRPVIHFSIPTRHKLLPISTLIKRQKGLKRDGKGDAGQNIETKSGEDKSQDVEDDEDEDEEDRPKISLVAEIFGSGSDEDEEETEQAPESHPKSDQPDDLAQQPPVELEVIDPGRWKIVAEQAPIQEPPVAPPTERLDPPSPQPDKETLPGEDELEIIEIVTINLPAPTRLRNMRRRPYIPRLENGEPEVIDIEPDEDERSEVAPNIATPPSEQSPPREVEVPPPEVSKEGEKGDSSPDRERQFKRPHSSSSMSNWEEGEIVDQVNPKKRKKDKKKKTKRRKRSKDSTPPKNNEKRLSDGPPNASDHEDNGGSRNSVSWRKPSKRSQARNYRDGKPKADDTFFREKEGDEKQRGNSPLHRRGRTSARREKSPAKEKSGGKHRRDGSPRNRSHSKSPPRASRSRSRSSGRPYRSRRRNRHSRSKSSNSASDKQTRRRSRRRYRGSPSRHHVGDSRSPSYITEPIRSRSLHYSKLRERSRDRSRSRDRPRARHRKRTVSPPKSQSPARSHRKNKKVETVERKKPVKDKTESPPEVKEKKKEKEKAKEKRPKKKEKPKEEEKKVKEKPKEKEKKKKRKRREKSPTPVKAIVADGDSIVVSLSFQKGKTASTVQPSASPERAENGLDTSTSSESSGKSQGPVVDDTETPGGSEEPQGVENSPEKLSSVTDEEEPGTEGDAPQPETRDEKETEPVKVTSSGGGSCGSTSPEGERSFTAAADSTKIVTPQQNETHDAAFSRLSLSPTDVEGSVQGDSVVTSTGDSMDTPAVAEEDPSKTTTPAKPGDGKLLGAKVVATVSPRLFCPPVSGGTGSSETAAATNANAPNSQIPIIPARPVIGNIPGLYPSNAIITVGGTPVPPPVVIPAPPPPRFSGNAPMLNPNVLASVASALLAVRQTSPNFSHGKTPAPAPAGGSVSNSDSSQNRHVTVLAPRTQNNFQNQSTRNSTGNNFSQEGGGDSPMSPNSSDGDDLFEPPLEKSQGDASKGGKGAFPNPPVAPNPPESFNSTGPSAAKPRERGGLFDSLFGGNEPKKTVSKPEKFSKNKAKHRKGPKKETIKVATSGGVHEGELRLTEEVPTSAVELIVKQKYLKKLNRQERVVEEVKLSLKPYYSKRQISKDEYKDILRRAVPKICHNKTGEINPGKIKELVEAYVKKFRHARKRGDSK